MKAKIFAIGFGISLALLIVCAAYAFSPRWSANFELFFSRDAGYVGSPPAFRYALGAFGILNLPAIAMAVGAIYAADAIAIAGSARLVIVFAVMVITAAAWWWAIASYSARRMLRRSQRLAT